MYLAALVDEQMHLLQRHQHVCVDHRVELHIISADVQQPANIVQRGQYDGVATLLLQLLAEGGDLGIDRLPGFLIGECDDRTAWNSYYEEGERNIPGRSVHTRSMRFSLGHTKSTFFANTSPAEAEISVPSTPTRFSLEKWLAIHSYLLHIRDTEYTDFGAILCSHLH